MAYISSAFGHLAIEPWQWQVSDRLAVSSSWTVFGEAIFIRHSRQTLVWIPSITSSDFHGKPECSTVFYTIFTHRVLFTPCVMVVSNCVHV